MLPFEFDFKNPDYIPVFQWRATRLERIRNNPACLPQLKRYYRDNPIDFIIDWGCTSDPRNVSKGQPALVPFLPFPKQQEWLRWFLDRWHNNEPGLTEKSREMGVTWLAVAISVTLCLFHDNLVIGFGSRKEMLVDKLGDPNSIFEKIRQFIQNLPPEFQGGWTMKKHAPYMRVAIPETRSTIIGEGGENLGRGGRTGIYWVDESAHLSNPESVDMALSETTNCRQDISTPNGMGNSFAAKIHGGRIPKFRFHWRDDIRKDEAWYTKKCKDIDNPVIIAQELDLDYYASVEGVLIPSAWVQAAVDAHVALNIRPSGERRSALDVADEGPDLNSQNVRHGIVVQHCISWSGGGSDIYKTTQRCVRNVEEWNGKDLPEISYDSDGLGVGVRGDANVINEQRERQGERPISFRAFRGSGKVIAPDGQTMGKKNVDLFKNAKSQGWWGLRHRFKLTYEAIREGAEYNPDTLISLSSEIEELNELLSELCQVTYGYNGTGKLVINKAPKGMKSPNRADALMICFAPVIRGLWDD